MVTDRRPFIATYIQANRPFGTLYVGMTSNLLTRANDHRHGRQKGFTSR
jgi:putative endonuclease